MGGFGEWIGRRFGGGFSVRTAPLGDHGRPPPHRSVEPDMGVHTLKGFGEVVGMIFLPKPILSGTWADVGTVVSAPA